MHDIKWIRENPSIFDERLKTRGIAAGSSDILSLDETYRAALSALQDLQSKRNAIAKEIGQVKTTGGDVESLFEESNNLKDRMGNLEAESKSFKEKLDAFLSAIPQLPAEDVPYGACEKDNQILSIVGTPKKFNFSPLPHYELGEKLKQMDFEKAAKLSGSRFVILKGDLARLERALAQFMLDTHTNEYGYEEVSPPVLVRENALFGTGQLPKFEEDQFKTETGYYLTATSEITLTNLAENEIFLIEDFPMRYTAFTQCFRQEAGAAGRDTRGMIRVHQFAKVELVSIVLPEESEAEHERMTSCAEEILKRLDLPYRKVLLCTGDMGFCSKKTYDLEVWLPSQNEYREISSCSNCGDFQARRMQARFKDTEGQNKFVHTLNGSGLAVGRTLVAVLENYQQEDGTIRVPEVLIPYMNGKEIIG